MTTLPNEGVAFAGAGDVVRIGHALFMLYRHCDRAIRAYHCVTHDQKLANRFQLEMHLETAGEHRIVSFCAQHGYEAGRPQ